MPNCFVKGCKNTSKNGTRLFVFPRDEKRRQIWSAKCGRNSTAHSRICEHHFEESQFESKRPGEWRKLKANAIPTIFNRNDLVQDQMRSTSTSASDSDKNKKINKDILVDDRRNESMMHERSYKRSKRDTKEHHSSILLKQTKLKSEYINNDNDNDINKIINNYTENHKEKFNFEKICRTCSCEYDGVTTSTTLTSLFTMEWIDSNMDSIDLCRSRYAYADMLIEITDLKIMEGDRYPQKICTLCVDKLKLAYTFIKQCQNVRAKFEEYLNQHNSLTVGVGVEVEADDWTTWTTTQQQQQQQQQQNDEESEIKQESLQSITNVLIKDHQDQDTDQDDDPDPEPDPDWNDDDRTMKNSESSGEYEEEYEQNKTKKKKQRLKMHECPTCLKKTHHLKDHMRTHTKPYKCDECGMRFSRRSNCVRHKKIHVNEALKKALKNENDGEKTKKKYKRRFHECPICTRKTQHLKVHMRSHTKEKPYKCDLCGRQFASRSNYSRHVKIHLNERPHVCEICNRAFTIRHSLVSHMKTHSTETSFKCELCEQAFKHLSQLKQHTSEAHQDNEQLKDILASIDPQRNFLCDLCGKSYLRRYEFEGHLRAHTGEKPFSCSVCGKTFSTSPLLYLHRKTHSIEKPHKCTYCDKHFRTRQLCKRHELIHTGEKPLKCDLCGKCFRKSSHLTRHKRTHTGEKPYGCNICNKHFIVRDRLNAHIRIQHTGETPYTCTVCHEKFADLKILRRHEKKLHTNTTTTLTSNSSLITTTTVLATNTDPVTDPDTCTVVVHDNSHIVTATNTVNQQQVEVVDSQSQFLFC